MGATSNTSRHGKDPAVSEADGGILSEPKWKKSTKRVFFCCVCKTPPLKKIVVCDPLHYLWVFEFADFFPI